mmetsp:Transcript_30502/g.61305  ORF Transcript_30502/g.61305 Transcript_30502/m.61305 type:complete len:114 (-) Transcript_30502:381-722(-)
MYMCHACSMRMGGLGGGLTPNVNSITLTTPDQMHASAIHLACTLTTCTRTVHSANSAAWIYDSRGARGGDGSEAGSLLGGKGRRLGLGEGSCALGLLHDDWRVLLDRLGLELH